jgi:hypothetical protein
MYSSVSWNKSSETLIRTLIFNSESVMHSIETSVDFYRNTQHDTPEDDCVSGRTAFASSLRKTPTKQKLLCKGVALIID